MTRDLGSARLEYQTRSVGGSSVRALLAFRNHLSIGSMSTTRRWHRRGVSRLVRNTTLTMGLLLLLLACLDERRLYSVTIVNAAQRDLKEVSVGFPGYSVRLPLAAGGRAGELQVPFALPRTANVAWTNMDGTVHRQLVRFPEKGPATSEIWGWPAFHDYQG